jgi:hypothetical protein
MERLVIEPKSRVIALEKGFKKAADVAMGIKRKVI